MTIFFLSNLFVIVICPRTRSVEGVPQAPRQLIGCSRTALLAIHLDLLQTLRLKPPALLQKVGSQDDGGGRCTCRPTESCRSSSARWQLPPFSQELQHALPTGAAENAAKQSFCNRPDLNKIGPAFRANRPRANPTRDPYYILGHNFFNFAGGRGARGPQAGERRDGGRGER
jgi:hypothetical protein